MEIENQKFNGKVVLITAGSTGIGLACAKKLASEGAILIISSRSKSNVEKAVQEIEELGGKVEGIVVHASNKADVKKMLMFVKEKYGRIDILIPNAAVTPYYGPFLSTTEQAMDKMFEVNFKAVQFLIKESLPLMYGVRGASIIIMSSSTAYQPEENFAFYSITKTMVSILAKLVAHQVQQQNIRCNAVCPGLIKTKMSSVLYEGKEQQVIKEMQISRLGDPQDIANIVSFLASQDAQYITGNLHKHSHYQKIYPSFFYKGESIIIGGRAYPRL